MSETTQSSYRQIFKATTLFGGVQAFNILIGLFRAKFVALFLGPAGMGIMNLLLIPIGLIGQLTGLGLGYSAIRNISQASTSGDEERIGRTLSVFKKWVWWTGISGVIVTLILSPLLSRWTFGNGDYTYAFIFLSITLLINSLSSGYSAVLQGMRKLRHLARAAVIGSGIGLTVSIPLYYYFRLNGIVPTIIVAAITTLCLNWVYSRKIKVFEPALSLREVWREGNSMVKLGILITISGLVSTLVSYLVNIYISQTGGVDQVGLYQAGFSITDKYVGLIFAAMATDYYPRLSSVIQDHKRMVLKVNQQAEVALLILGPILVLLMTSLPLIVRILYTPKFMSIIDFVPWIVLGIPLKAATWALGFIILAKGDSKLFFVSELLANLVLLCFSLIGYKLYGLKGIGIAFVAMYIIYFFFIYTLSRLTYKYSFSKPLVMILITTVILCSIGVSSIYSFGFPLAYYTGATILFIAVIFSWVELNKRIDLQDIILKMLRRFGKQ